MHVSKVRELREKRAHIVSEAQRLLPAKGSMSAEDKARFEVMMTEADALKDEIDAEERKAELALLDGEIHRTRRPPEAQIGNGSGFEEARSSAADRRYRQAFGRYLRFGLRPDEFGSPGLQPDDYNLVVEKRDMGVGTGNLGGYFVPQGFVYDIEIALKFISGLYAAAGMLDTSTGNPMPHPTSNDTSVAATIVGEGQQVSTADVSVGQVVFGAYKFSTQMVKVSLELAQDSAFDMDAFLKQQFAVRLARGLNPYLTTGLGSSSNQPMGVITAATASGQVVIGDDNAATPDPTTQVGYLDLVNLEHSLDPLYRTNAKFMMHDTTLRFIKTLKDKYGRPLWVPGVATNAPDTILGYRYFCNNDMATLATKNITVAFGDFSKYTIRRVKELAVLRLVERFADYGQVAFLGFARYDGNLLDAGTHPIKYLKQA